MPHSRRFFIFSTTLLPLYAKARTIMTNTNIGKPSEVNIKDIISLVALCKYLSTNNFLPRKKINKESISGISYDVMRNIYFDSKYAIFSGLKYPITFFFLDPLHTAPIRVFTIVKNNVNEVTQSSHKFVNKFNRDSLPKIDGECYAGFRILLKNSDLMSDPSDDWVSFLGASYFRATGQKRVFGASARGVAINTLVGNLPEEFPDFTTYWIQEEDATVIIYALLDGPSLVGGYKFSITRNRGTIMNIEAYLFPRKHIKRLGIAPITSMYWYSETNHIISTDWRPEVHDSDGLSILTSTGERVWRPLINPQKDTVSIFSGDRPKGFGLLQRDKNVSHYQDLRANYHNRPDVWVEPTNEWGKGSIQLVELSSDDEIYDNVVMMWVPEKPILPGDSLYFSYNLYWEDNLMFPSSLARCVETRLGRGGMPGGPYPNNQQKFVVTFEGENVFPSGNNRDLDVNIKLSAGQYNNVKIIASLENSILVEFDLNYRGADDCFIEMNITRKGKIITETWVYNYSPTVRLRTH